MTTPTINLTQLRAEYNVTRFRGLTFVQMLTPDTLLALIDTAEAAIHWWVEGIETQEPYDARLAETLDRFDLTPPA